MRLSVCVPTHDGRGEVLRQSLSSILHQITPELRGQVEICISDNASRDETQAFVAECRQQYPGLIRYGRNSENLGFTRNLMSVIALAEGDFCWLFSSDDTMAANGLARVLEVLEQNPCLTGITVDIQSFDSRMNPLPNGGYLSSLLPKNPEQTQVFTSPEQIFRECGSVQGYTSGQIFDRRLWMEALQEAGEQKITSFVYFPYLYLFGKMVKKRPTWMWLPLKLVNNRTNNDYLSAHLQRHALRYHTLTMEEASRVWGDLFGRQSATYQSLMRENFLSLWNAKLLVYYKGLSPCTAGEELRALVWFTRRLFFLPQFWVTAFPVLLIPSLFPRLGAALILRLGYQPKSKRAAAMVKE